jgi:hypothetical protein
MLGVPALAAGQSLAEIARREEARRKALARPGKVYTNEDLKPDPTGPRPSPLPAAPAAPTPAASGSETQPTAGQTPAGGAATSESAQGEVRDEAYWRRRITEARAALERSQIFADALQSRINALTTDFVNRDDPAQRAQIELERQRAIAELERVKKEIAEHTQAIAAIEEEARKAGVPPGWLR